MEEAKNENKNKSLEDQKHNEDEEGDDQDSETQQQNDSEEDNFISGWQSDIRNAESAYINSAKSFLEWVQKKINVLEEQIPGDPTVSIYDISHSKGRLIEDLKQQFLPVNIINIKRGNSICKIKNGKNDEIFFCRRGMRKFYDLIPEYFNENEELSGNNQKIKFLMLDDAKEKLESGQYKVHLYNLFKESGEHCQISYIKELDLWLIATKSATILIKNKEDAQKAYDNQLYVLAKQISNEWFDILDLMKKEDINKMQNLTFIGDYCGNQKHWPILQNEKNQIIFNSVVENNSPNVCLPVEEAFQIFNQFNLQTVRMTVIKNIETFEELKDKLNLELKKVASGRIEDEGQGEVVYIIAQDKNNSQQKTLSCCKLKNIEYNIYRKLREFLMVIVQKRMKSGLYYERFKWEVERMSEYHQPPKPLDHYFQLAKNSFAFFDKNLFNLSLDMLNFQFISFIKNINKQCRLILITLPGLMSDEVIDSLTKKLQIDQVETKWTEDQKINNQHVNLVYILPKISEKIKDQNLHFAFIGFDQEGKEKSLNILNDDIKQITSSKFSEGMSKFVNCKNKQKMIETYSLNVLSFQNQLESQYPSKYTIYKSGLSSVDLIKQLELTFTNMFSDCDEEKPESQTIQQNYGKNVKGKNETASKDKIKVTAILPSAIPGSGKTYFCVIKKLNQIKLRELLKNIMREEHPNCYFDSVSTDQIRKDIIDKYKEDEKYAGQTNQQLFQLASRETTVEYFKTIKTKLKEISAGSKQAIIFLDRLHLFDMIEDTCNYLKDNSPQNLDIKISVFVIKSSSELNFKNNSYYLSEQILLNCLDRTINRVGHETLKEDKVQTSKIVLRYFQMLRNFKIQTFKSQKYINLVAEIPLINEQMIQIDQALVQKIGKCLELIPPGDHAPKSKVYLDFIKCFNEANHQFEYPDKEKLIIAAKNYINDCLNIN